MAQLPKILDPRFGSGILANSEILQSYIVVPCDGDQKDSSVRRNEPEACSSDVGFMRSVLQDDSLHENYDDEVISFLRATAIADKLAAIFGWLHGIFLKEKRQPNIAVVAMDVLAIQVSSACSEASFSTVRNIIVVH